MNEPTGGFPERRRRWWSALGATAVFVTLGLALAPGLSRHEPAPAPTPDSQDLGFGPPADAARRPGPGPRDVIAPALPGAADPAGKLFDCMIEPIEVVEIGSAITGLIEEIPVERGDYVEAGAVVARLESTVEQAAVRIAEARAQRRVDIESSQASLELGGKRLERALALFEGNTLSRDLRDEMETEATLAALRVEQAREDHRLARLALDQAVASLERRTIRTPISGFVVDRLMAPGEVVEDDTILRIAQIDPLRVEVILPSELHSAIRRGARAEVLPEGSPPQKRSAEVAIVDPIIDAASGTFGVRLLLPNADRDLTGGLRCQVEFPAESPAESGEEEVP